MAKCHTIHGAQLLPKDILVYKVSEKELIKHEVLVGKAKFKEILGLH